MWCSSRGDCVHTRCAEGGPLARPKARSTNRRQNPLSRTAPTWDSAQRTASSAERGLRNPDGSIASTSTASPGARVDIAGLLTADAPTTAVPAVASVKTATTVRNLAKRHDVPMPVCEEIYEVVNGRTSAARAGHTPSRM